MRTTEIHALHWCGMDMQAYWDRVYSGAKPSERSWFRPHLELSLALIERSGVDHGAAILDVGGGESTLTDDLMAAGFRDLTVLDASQMALERIRLRLGRAEEKVSWICGDVLAVELPRSRYALWHDRAVFHFLTERSQRVAYVRQAALAVKPGGHIIVGAFGPEGPKQCSGLNVMRYDSRSLDEEFGNRFRLVESVEELHQTPSGATQPFVYCHWVVL